MDICADNLSGDVIGSDLHEVFESFGRVATTDVVKHGHDHKLKEGCGYAGRGKRPGHGRGLRAAYSATGRSAAYY